MKIVLNKRYGFSLSRTAFLRLREMGCKHAIDEADHGEHWKDGSGIRKPSDRMFCTEIDRYDRKLVEVVEELGSESASGPMAELIVLDVLDPSRVEIIRDEFGAESISLITGGSREDL